jgi:hypothetical protein
MGIEYEYRGYNYYVINSGGYWYGRVFGKDVPMFTTKLCEKEGDAEYEARRHIEEQTKDND